MDELVAEIGRGLQGLDRPQLWTSIRVAGIGSLLVVTTLLLQVVLGRGSRRGRSVAPVGSDAWVLVVAAGFVAGSDVLGEATSVGVVVTLAAAVLVAAVQAQRRARSRRHPPILDAAAVLLAGLGLYGTLPDTEAPVAFVGGAVVVVGISALLTVLAMAMRPLSPAAVVLVVVQLLLVVQLGHGGRARAWLAGALVVGAFVATTSGLFGRRVEVAGASDLVATALSSRWVGLADELSVAVGRAAVVVVVVAGLAVVAQRGSFSARSTTRRDR